MLNLYAKENKIIKLEYFDEEWSGVVLANSENFLLLRELKDFSYGGFVIFNKAFITSFSREKQEEFDEKVMLKCVQNPSCDVSWLDIKSFSSIYASLKKNFNGFCIDSTEDIDTFFVGKIVDFDEKSVSLKAVDTYARFYDEPIPIENSLIGYILFDDAYSTPLLKYSEMV